MPRASQLPSRLHHTAYTTRDMEKTRRFYEGVIGLPLIATWSESDGLVGRAHTYCLCSFGLADPDTFVLEHGYCRSLYVKDPSGLLLEFTLDAPDAGRVAKARKADARATLVRWLGRHHASNNVYR